MTRAFLHAVGDLSVTEPPEASERERGTADVLAQPLSARVILRGDPDGRVKIEALEDDGVTTMEHRWRCRCVRGVASVESSIRAILRSVSVCSATSQCILVPCHCQDSGACMFQAKAIVGRRGGNSSCVEGAGVHD